MVSQLLMLFQDVFSPFPDRYRAEIVAIQVNETMPHELLFDVYFLDYGDNQFIGKKDILELRADFLSLRFQAIECFLAHIHPSNYRSKLEEWDEKAVEKFEEMVQAAHWKKLISKVVAYKERKSFAFQRQSNKRESSPIPGVELYDPDENADKNIALELVKLGYAEITENFGDLTKSAILNSADEASVVIKTVKEKSPVKDEPVKEKTPLKDEPVKEKTPLKDEPVKEKSPLKEEQPQSPTSKAEAATNENHSKSASKTNGTTTEPATNLFKAQKPSKGNKKQQLSDFLKNEQQATSKKPKKSDTDWNAMLEE